MDGEWRHPIAQHTRQPNRPKEYKEYKEYKESFSQFEKYVYNVYNKLRHKIYKNIPIFLSTLLLQTHLDGLKYDNEEIHT